MTKEEGRRLIKENDHKLDQKILQDFLDTATRSCGMSLKNSGIGTSSRKRIVVGC